MNPASCHNYIKWFCQERDCTFKQLTSHKRNSLNATFRRFSIYFLLIEKGYPCRTIGELLLRDHKTVLHGHKRMTAYIKASKDLTLEFPWSESIAADQGTTQIIAPWIWFCIKHNPNPHTQLQFDI